MTTKQPDFSELNRLAIEACDMWQEHLSTLATDSDARAELKKFLEPQRRLFLDWAHRMKAGNGAPETATATGEKDDSRAQNQSAAPDAAPQPNNATAPAASRRSADGDDSLRFAQLALRVAELEKRLARLESQPRPPRKTQP